MLELAEAVEHELLAAGSRCPSFPTHIFTGLGEDDFDSHTATGRHADPAGTSVMFDFGGVVDGYCSDFGRTVYCGEPPEDFLDAYDVMLAAHEAGRRPRSPALRAREVNAACRAPIEDAGLGEHFRHRMGHGIGMDVHERPFLSAEDETPLEAGMTFTDEPSIIVPGRYGLRIDARKINACWAPAGTVITTPSSRACLFQVSTFVNQSSGGGLVEPRRNAAIMRKRTDSPSGMSGWIQMRSPACRFGTREIGRVLPARVTLISILGPARSNAAVSA